MWMICQWSNHDSLMLLDALKHIFWYFNVYLKMSPFFHFLMFFLAYHFHFFCFLPLFSCETDSLPPAASALPPCLPFLRSFFSLLSRICMFEQWIKSYTENVIFFFNLRSKRGEALIWPKFLSPAVDFLLGTEERREASFSGQSNLTM